MNRPNDDLTSLLCAELDLDIALLDLLTVDLDLRYGSATGLGDLRPLIRARLENLKAAMDQCRDFRRRETCVKLFRI